MQRPERTLLVLREGGEQLLRSLVLERVVGHAQLLQTLDGGEEVGQRVAGLRVDLVLVQVDLLELRVPLERVEDVAEALVANAVELQPNRIQVRLLLEHGDELVDRVIVDVVVVQVDLLQGAAALECDGDGLNARIADAVVLNTEFDQLVLIGKALHGDLDSAGPAELVVTQTDAGQLRLVTDHAGDIGGAVLANLVREQVQLTHVLVALDRILELDEVRPVKIATVERERLQVLLVAEGAEEGQARLSCCLQVVVREEQIGEPVVGGESG